MEETAEKSGEQMSTDLKQKTQPDGHEEFCQYGLCCDACKLLLWRDREKKDRSLKEDERESTDRTLSIGNDLTWKLSFSTKS